MSCVGKDGGKGRCSALELGDGRASKKLKLRHDGSTVSACFAAEDRELVDIALGSPVEANQDALGPRGKNRQEANATQSKSSTQDHSSDTVALLKPKDYAPQQT